MSMENVTSTGKDTIYIDVDDEITTLIDKVRSSHARIVALVLPKRATVLQSIVNMKLLKHSADAAKKHLVLITSEASLLPLAGSVGVYVAKTLQSKPEVPPAPPAPSHEADDAEEEAVHLDDETPGAARAGKSSKSEKLDAHKTVGELAKGVAADEAIDEALELDDELDAAGDVPDKPQRGGKGKGKDKKLSIPNFDKFRLLLGLGALAFVGLIVLVIVCVKVLPKATVVIGTDRQAVSVNGTLALDTSAKTVDATGNTIPAQSQQIQKTLTGQVPTTGQKNNGTPAAGTISVSAGTCTPNQPNSIAAGTGVTANNLTYITQSTISFVPVLSHGKCTYQGQTSSGASDIAIAAQAPGANYNTNGTVAFTVSGRSDVSASGSASNGTDNIVQVVAAADITSAQSKITMPDQNSIKQQLESNLSSAGLTPIAGTFNASTPTPSPSANAGDQATTVTVTEQITYTMLGAKQTDLQAYIKTAVGKQIDTSKQAIVDYGLSSASFSQPNVNGTVTSVSFSDTAVVGAQLDTTAIAKAVAGKKTADATNIIKANPGVTTVTIKYSPFWVSSVPGNASKVTVQIQKPQKTVSNE